MNHRGSWTSVNMTFATYNVMRLRQKSLPETVEGVCIFLCSQRVVQTFFIDREEIKGIKERLYGQALMVRSIYTRHSKS